MTKIFNKILILLFAILVLTLSGCSCKMFTTEVYECEGEILLHIKDEFYDYMPYEKEDVPNFTFKFPGKLNFTVNTTGPNEVVFSNNDDFVVSDIIKDFLKYYEQNGIVSYREISTMSKYETHLNKKVTDENGNIKNERVYFKVTNGELHNMIAYITLDNGLQLTLNYCTFEGTNEGVSNTYFTWEYTQSIRLSLYYPLMVTEVDGERIILIVALPNQVINKIEPRYDASGLVNKDAYLNESFYTYPYSDYDESNPTGYNNTNSVEKIKDYYINNLGGILIDDDLYYSYLGYDFKVVFGSTHFVISCVGKSK